jgi:hypothetical protein
MCASAHIICRPPFLPADFKKEQAGRTQGFHTLVRYPSLVLSLSRPSITLLSLSRRKTRCRAHATLPGEGADGRTERRVGQSNREVRFWQHTERTLADDCHTATSW